MAEKYMWIKLTKEWGGFQVGDIVRFGWNKGEGRIAAGQGERVKPQRAVNDPPEPEAELKVEPKPPVVETATAEPEEIKEVETAEVTPRRRGRQKKEN